jgi:2-keto-4-pentenoate hydratase/2-oxohepta-3-ene-1,7-dioic acid hydratase in catechol pathway
MKSIALDGTAVYPSKIVCIGRNYAEHIKELDNEPNQEPVIFIKPNSAISDEIYSSESELIHYEGEITFLIESGELGPAISIENQRVAVGARQGV